MRYQLLPLASYQAFAGAIRSLYKECHTGSESPMDEVYIALFEQALKETKSLPDAQAAKVFLGLGAVIRESIEHEYWRSPSQRSKIYTLISQHFNINDRNQMNATQKTIFANQYYLFLKSASLPAAVDRAELLKQLIAGLARIHARNYDEINAVKKSRPDLDGIKKIIEDCFEKYQEKNQQRYYPSVKREPLLRFISFIHFSSDKFYNDEKEVSGPLKRLCRENELNMRVGIIVFVLMHIYQEYYIRNPKSILFKNLQKELNVNLASISDSFKQDIFHVLNEYITKFVKGNQYDYYNLINEWKLQSQIHVNKNIDNATFIKEMNQFQTMLVQYKTNPSVETWTGWAMKGAASQLAKLGLMGGIGYATSQVGPRLALAGATSAFVAPAMGVTAAVLLLWAVLSKLIGDNILSKAQGYVFSWVFTHVDSSIDNTVGALINYSFSQTPQGFEDIVNKLSPDDRALFEEWINTLLVMPVEIVSEDEKACIRKQVGILPGQQWHCQSVVRPFGVELAAGATMVNTSHSLQNMILDDYDASHIARMKH